MKKILWRLQCKFGRDNVSFLMENGWSDFYETIFLVLYNVCMFVDTMVDESWKGPKVRCRREVIRVFVIRRGSNYRCVSM